MATLYELTGKYHQLLDLAEDTDPTLFNDTMDSITDAIKDKAENYFRVMKNMDQQISEISGLMKPFEEETKRLQKRIDGIEKSKKRLKEALTESMKETNTQKITTPLVTLWIQDNQPSLKLVDESKIPAYLTKTDIVPDKTRIKQLLKEGKDVPGAELSTSSSLRIR